MPKIDHRGVTLPDPSVELIEAMARSGYDTCAESAFLLVNLWMGNWDEAKEINKIAWRESARAMYATMALAAGAKLIDS